MHRNDKSTDDPTLMRPFRRVVPKHQQEAAEQLRTPRARVPAPAAKPGSQAPRIVVGGALLLLIAGIGGAVHLLLDRQEPAVVDAAVEDVLVEQDLAEEDLAEEDLADEDLFAIEQVPMVLPIEPPAIIDLSGDPVVLPRPQQGLRRVREIQLEPPVASALTTAGPLYHLRDDLLSPEVQMVSGVTASQQNFAFFQPETGQAETVAGPAGEQQAADPDPHATIYYVESASRMEGPGRRDSFLSLATEEAPADLLARQAWSGEHAQLLQEAVARFHGIQTFQPGDGIAITGYRSPEDPSLYVPGRLVLYRGSEYAGALALTTRGDYAEGVDPWFGELPFEEPRNQAALSASVSLLDAVYGAALRNVIPADIAGEAILTLSRTYDLSQTVKAGDRITLLYTPEPRDPSSGFGKVLYIGIDREADAIACYVFQSGRGKSFTCVTAEGHAKDTGDGMTTPVSGVISTKFGPRKDPKTGKVAMHPGVSWAAPAGTAVVAAFAGTVESAGTDPVYGNFLKIAHSDGRVTAYGHLQSFAPHIETGVEVEAGGFIGTVGKTGNTAEPQLFFQLLRNGQPTDPFATFQRVIESGGAVDALIQRIIYVESAGNPRAKNPLSTATGLGQFIDSTWLTMINANRPDLAQGRTREQILALRTDPEIATEMVAALARRNASYLRSRGQPDTSGNLYLSHFLGPEGAVIALSADPETPLAQLFPASVIKANPFLNGWSAARVIKWAEDKMSKTSKKGPAVAAPEPPRNQFASDNQFVALKQAIETVLN